MADDDLRTRIAARLLAVDVAYGVRTQQSVETARADRRRENGEQTRAALKRAGRVQFGTLGFEAASVTSLCEAAGVTAGALYHHFGDKKGLFAAVAEDLDIELVRLAGQARDKTLSLGGDGWAAFLASIDALLLAGPDPGRRRIGLVEASAVLGAEAWIEIRKRHGLGALVQTMEQLQSLGLIEPGDSLRRARLVLGLVYGAMETLPAAATADHEAVRDTRRHVHAMLEGLRRVGTPGESA